MPDDIRPRPHLRHTLGGLGLLVLALAPLPAAAEATLTSTLVPANPPPDVGTVAANANDAADMGISIDQYAYCQVCSPQPYTQVATCPTVVGTQQACQAYCHVIDASPVTYGSNPPHSGNHHPEPERGIGEHTSPIDRGFWVHSMEHGAVMFLYNCPSDCSSDLAVFRTVLNNNPCLPIIMVPEPTLKQRYAMTAWTWTAASDQMFTPSQVDCFAKQHAKHGRECPVGGVCPSFIFSSAAATQANCPSVVATAP